MEACEVVKDGLVADGTVTDVRRVLNVSTMHDIELCSPADPLRPSIATEQDSRLVGVMGRDRSTRRSDTHFDRPS